MDEHTIKFNTETRRNKEQVKNIKHIVPPHPKEKQRTSLAWSPILLRRKLPMAWGTTTDRVTAKINPFPICKRDETSNTKGSQNIPYSGWLM